MHSKNARFPLLTHADDLKGLIGLTPDAEDGKQVELTSLTHILLVWGPARRPTDRPGD